MVAYNFKSQFADDVAAGRKRQTIRAEGKRRHAMPGDSIQLYTGMRTKACRKLLAPDPACKASLPISISALDGFMVLVLDGRTILGSELRAMAKADGFGDVEEMKDFFSKTHGLPFEGRLIMW